MFSSSIHSPANNIISFFFMAVGKVKTTSFLNKKFGREREMQSTYPETIIFYNLFLSNLCF
jgi:hypothetical protein